MKLPQFPFMRSENSDPVTGIKKVSTGEITYFGRTFEEAFIKSLR